MMMRCPVCILLLIFICCDISHAQWQALNGPPGGSAYDIEIDADNNKIYTLVNNDNLFVSSDGGVSWTELPAMTSIGSTDVLVDGPVMYSVTAVSFYKSEDGGVTWVRMGLSGQFLSAQEILKHPTEDVIFIYGFGGLWVTYDEGVSWTKLNDESTSSAVVSSSGDLFFADTEGIGKHSLPGAGDPWAKENVSIVNALSNNTIELAVSGADIYAATKTDVLKSSNGGTSWPSIKTATITEANIFYPVWAVSGNGVYLATSNKFYFTGDGGANWEERSYPTVNYSKSIVNDIKFLDNTNALAVSTTDGVFKTTNAGAIWTMSNTGIKLFPGKYIAISATGGIICAGTSGYGYWYSDDSGTTWAYKDLAVLFQKVMKLPNNTLLALGNSALRISTDNGTSWTTNTSNAILHDATFNTTFSATFFASGNTRIAKSTDADTWTDLSITGLPASFSSTKLGQDDAGRLYVHLYNSTIGKYQVYRIDGITAGGTTGTATLLTLPLGESDAASFQASHFFVSNNKIYAGTLNYIYISSDQGSTWRVINFRKNSLFPVKKGTTYAICAGTAGTLFTSQDDGQTWISTKLPFTNTNAYISNIEEDAAGDYYAAGNNCPTLKFIDDLVLPPASLPVYIDYNWQPTNGPYGGFTAKVFTDNSNNSYTLSTGVVYKTTPAFPAWSVKSEGILPSDIEIDKSSNTLYATTSTALYTSVNGGDTWELLNDENITSRRLLARCPNGDIVFVRGTSDIYVSTDGGSTFGGSKYTSAPNQIIDLSVTSSNAIIATLRTSATPAVYLAVISTDRGVTWDPLNLNVNGSSEFLRISGDASGTIFSTLPPLSKSSDNGQTWTSIAANLPYSSMISKVFESPSAHLYVAASEDTFYPGALFKSTDGGNSWVKRGDLPSGLSGVNAISWIGTRMILATIQGIYISDDDGATYIVKNENIPSSSYLDLDVVNPSSLISTSGGNAFFRSTDTGWDQTDAHGIRYLFPHPDGSLLGHSYVDLYSSTDLGSTWTKISTFPEPLFKVATGNGVTYYGVSNDTLFVSTDLSTWSVVLVTGLPESFNYIDLAIDMNGLVYALVFNTETISYAAYQIAFGSASLLDDFASPRRVLSHKDKLYVYESSGVLSYTTDGGNWTSQSTPAGTTFTVSSNGYYFIPQSPGGLWLSRDEGSTWQSIGLNTTATNQNFINVAIDEFTGHAYATISNSVIRKSAGIVIPAETDAPTVEELFPANGATNTSAESALRITFNEGVVPVAGKKVRIFNADDKINPIEIIDASAGTQNGKTFIFTPANAFAYTETFFVTIDNGAFKDIFNNLFAGINSEFTWRFTIQEEPDNIKPTIGYSANSPAFIKGQTNKLTITVTDDNNGSGVNASSAKIFYRGITSTGTPAEAPVPLVTGNTFEVSVPDGWMDELGLEFRFEAKDIAGNIQSYPDDGTFERGYIGFPTDQKPALPSTLLTSGGQVENYRIFSIPYALSDAKISTIFDELSGQTVKTDYRILHFNSESGTTTDYPSLSTITRGLGYWINIKEPPSIAVEGATTPSNSKDGLFSLSLKAGWNQIGNPYPFTISWNAVRAANADIGVLKSFNGTSWVEDDKINPFEGGFVFLDGSATVNVEVPFSAKTTAGRTKDEITDFEGGWMLPFTVENSRFRTAGGVGMHPEARMSFDHFDDAMPPMIFEVPTISFGHPEHNIKSLTRDVVPPQTEYTWDFSVNGGDEGAVVRWNASDARSISNDVYLFDIHSQKLISMSEEDHCTVGPQRTSSFRIYYGIPREDIKPSMITLGKPYPNPFVDRSKITFTLPENQSGLYNVLLEVYDNLGRKVTTLARGAFTSGFYTGEWIPEPGTLNASLYLYRLTVSDKDSNITLTEKIITQK